MYEDLLQWIIFTTQSMPWYMIVGAILLIIIIEVWICELVWRTFMRRFSVSKNEVEECNWCRGFCGPNAPALVECECRECGLEVCGYCLDEHTCGTATELVI